MTHIFAGPASSHGLVVGITHQDIPSVLIQRATRSESQTYEVFYSGPKEVRVMTLVDRDISNRPEASAGADNDQLTTEALPATGEKLPQTP